MNNDKMREAFEKGAQGTGLELDWNGYDYDGYASAVAFKMYKAALQSDEVRRLVDALYKAEHDLATPLYIREIAGQALTAFTGGNDDK